MNAQNIAAPTLAGRPHYRSSGDFNFTAVLTWLLPALGVAILLAVLMDWLFHVGHYYVIIVPIICALAVAGMARLTVAKGHCRNRILGGLIGAGLGLVLYLGSYYVGMIRLLGPEIITRPDVLVEYIRMRMATDVVRDSYDDADDDPVPQRGAADFMNWARFTLECVGVLVIVAASAARRANKIYCEQCQSWMLRETSPFDPAQTPGILKSLETNSPRALAAHCLTASYQTLPNTTMAVDYCPTLKQGIARDCPVFLSLKNVTANPQGATLDSFEKSKGKIVERCVELNHDELPALAARFPVFEAYAGRGAVTALLPKAEAAPPGRAGESLREWAEIVSLPPEQQGRVFTRAMKWKGNLYSAVGLVGIFSGIALLAWGATRLEAAEKIGGATDGLGIGLCVAGGASILFALVGMLFDSSFGGNRMLRKAFISEVTRRDGAFVDVTDPAARFVEVVPKLNWGKTMLDTASDVGLLLVDHARKEIRFEGDLERWRLPAASITSCRLEQYVHGQGAGATKLYYVVLRADRAAGFWEAPIRERHNMGLFAGKREKIASRLQADIQQLCNSVPKQTS